MASRSPDPVGIASLLDTGEFVSRETPVVAEDPAEPVLMVLPLDKIEFSRHNPRTSRNTRFEEIRDSIIHVGGLITMLTVTRFPGEAVYRLDAGGNTRLAAIKAAFEETGDPRLATLNVLFKPYEGETRVLVNHLIENNMRSDNSFIERAVAIQQTIELLIEEKKLADPDQISDRKWIAMIDEGYGYPVPRSSFIAYRYALGRLAETIPNALKSGMGRPTVERIQRLENAYGQYCETHGVGRDQFEIIFDMVLSGCDSDNAIDLEQVENALLDEINQHTGASADTIAQQIPRVSVARASTPPPGMASDPVARLDEAPGGEVHSAAVSGNGADGAYGNGADGNGADASESAQKKSNGATPIELALIQREIYQAARDVAKPFGLHDLIKATEFGYGFYIEYPPNRLETEYQSACWWFLLHLSDILQQEDPFLWLSQDSLFGVLLKQFATEGKAVLFAKFGAIVGQSSDAGEWIPGFLTLPRGEFGRLTSLLECVRQIRKRAGVDDG